MTSHDHNHSDARSGVGMEAVMFRSLVESWGRRIGRDVAKKVVADHLKSDAFRNSIDDAIRRELAKPEYAHFRFIKGMQAALQKADPSIPDKQAFYRARDAYNEYLRDEKIKFGDPRYDWSASGAHEIAQAYEIDFWEPKP